MERAEVVFPATLHEVNSKGFMLFVPCSGANQMFNKDWKLTVRLSDSLCISDNLRAAIFATERDLSAFTCYWPSEMHDVLKQEYYARSGSEEFSLSNCSWHCGSEYLAFLIELCVELGVPVYGGLINRCNDVRRYVYACLKNKKCCVTGATSQLHHVDAVGAGRNRNTIVHLGMRVLPLSAELHKEIHTIGKNTFLEKYHLEPVELTAEICDIYGLRKGCDWEND